MCVGGVIKIGVPLLDVVPLPWIPGRNVRDGFTSVSVGEGQIVRDGLGQNGRDTEGIMLGAGGLQLLGWVRVSVSGVGWVQEMGVGEFALKVVLSDRDTTCWFFLEGGLLMVWTLCTTVGSKKKYMYVANI